MSTNIVINEKKIRTLLIKTENKFITKEVVSRLFGLDKTRTIEVLDCLDKQGYIEKSNIEGFWQQSIRAKLLINKKFSQEFKPETVREQVKDLVERAKMINSSSKYPDRIVCMKIMSEYPIEHKSTGVHIAYSLTRKNITDEEYDKAADKLWEQSNTSFGNQIEYIFYPEEAIRVYLQSRSHVLKLKQFQEEEIGQINGYILLGEE